MKGIGIGIGIGIAGYYSLGALQGGGHKGPPPGERIDTLNFNLDLTGVLFLYFLSIRDTELGSFRVLMSAHSMGPITRTYKGQYG